MPDYSYCIVRTQPPRPRITFWIWIESWVQPVRGWTKGEAYSAGKGVVDARAHWKIHKGKARQTSNAGLIHTCGTPSTCSCNTERQLPQEATA